MNDPTQPTATQPPSADPAIHWGALENCPPQQLIAHDIPVAVSGNTLSVIVPNLRVDLQSEEQPLHSACVAAFQIPVTLPADGIFVGYKTDIRGAVTTSAGTRATLFLDIGGMAQVVEFPFGQERNTPFERDLFSLQSQDTGGDFSEHPLTPSLYITLALLVQRQTPVEIALVEINTLDILALFNGRRPSDTDTQPEDSSA